MTGRQWSVLLTALIAVPLAAQGNDMPIRNYHVVDEHIGTGGTPGSGAMEALSEDGYALIIDLREDIDSNEARDAMANGMSYIHVPVSWRSPDSEELEAFMLVMEANPEKKVFVHCAANYRASAMVYLYQVIGDGKDSDLAFEDVEAVWEPNDTWREFIDESLAAATDQ